MPPEDIFGNAPASLDTSDLDSKWEPDVTAADAVAAHDAEVDEVDDEEVDEDGPALDDASDEEAADDEDEPADDPLLSHELVKGKTPEELAKLAIDSRQMVGRQSAEVSELRRVTEEQAGQLKELIGYITELQQPQLQVDTTGVVAMAVDNPQAAYHQALQLVNSGQATPDLVEEVIDATADMNPSLARQLTRDFDRRLLRAEMRAELQERVDPLAKNDYQSQLNAATASLYADPELGADAAAYFDDIVGMLQGQPLGSNQQEIRAKIESALVVARGQNPVKSSAYKKALDALKADAQTEAGNGPEAPPAKKSEADTYRERVFARATQRDPGAGLFA